MNSTPGQPGMGGNVVQAQSGGSGRRGRGVFSLINSYLENAAWKQKEDYRTSQAQERYLTQEAAKTAGHIIRGRSDSLNYNEMLDVHQRKTGKMPKRLVVGDVSHDYGSDQPNPGDTPPKGGKGGKGKNNPPRKRPGTLKDVQAALKAGHIDEEQAADISTTYAQKLGRKEAADIIKNKPQAAAKPKGPAKPTNKSSNPVPPTNAAPVNAANAKPKKPSVKPPKPPKAGK